MSPRDAIVYLPESLLLRSRASLLGSPRRTIRERIARARATGRPVQVELYFESPCRQACEFCPVPREREELRGRAVHALIDAHYRAGLDALASGALDAVLDEAARSDPPALVSITGHDWAEHPGLDALLARLEEERRVPVRFVGPSTRLADRALAARVAALPTLEGVTLTLEADDPAVHDAIIGAPGSGARVLQAISALRAAGVTPAINLVLARRAVEVLPRTLAWLDREGLRAALVMVWPLGHRHRWDARALMAPMPELHAQLGAATDAASRVVHTIVGVPRCAVPNALRERIAPPWESGDRDAAAFGAPCARCDERSLCGGVPASYREAHGDHGLTPIEKTRRPRSALAARKTAGRTPAERQHLPAVTASPPSPTPMRTATVLTNLVCNQHCGFCTFRRAADEPGFTSTERIRAEIGRAGAVETLVLSGGEPTLLPDLADHVRFARELGVKRVVVETNGMLLAYEGRAKALADAGVAVLRVALNAAEHARSDALTETPGGTAITLRGIRAAIAAGLEVVLSVAVVRSELDALPSLAAAIPEGVSSVLLHVVTDAGPDWVPRYDDAARAVCAFVDAARQRGVNVSFEGRHAIPLCFFPERRRYPELFAGGMPREAHGMLRIAECDGCAARDRCPGVPASYVALHGEHGAEKVPERQQRFVLGLGRDRRGAVERELVNDAFFHGAGGGVERVLRVNFHCNQACGFCFVDRTLPAVSPERIRAEIDRARDEGIAFLSLSGGEPTLHPDLPAFVRAAKANGLRTQIQTNAVRCADRAYVKELTDAGLERAFVSLHAPRAELSDEITAAKGTFDRTIEGITALADAGVSVLLNHVITGANHRDLPEYARFVASRWGARVAVNFSFAHASTDLVPRDAETIPRLGDVAPSIGEAVRILREAAIDVQGLDGQCGMPLCVLDAGWLDRSSLAPLPSPAPPRGFSKTDECARCTLTDRCVGIRDTYAAIHGTSEIHAV